MHDEPLASRTVSPAYQLAMLVLCVFALGLLVLEEVFHLQPEIAEVLHHADTFICFVFLADFVWSFARAPRKLRYFVTWGWLDLLSSVPSLDFARWGRLARIARLTRVLRALRASRVITKLLFRHKGQSAALAAALLALFLIIGCSAAILRFEDSPDSNIKTADDAIWWAFTTITTVGYGDRYPVSGEGRFIAALLMTAGVGLFGAFSAALAAWFLAPEEEETNAELAALRRDIAALRQLIEERL
ncbi:MAG: ion transporter [Acidobacteriota bacterium]|nr:ion transporter [Acidobacteriota bacterium]